LLIETRLTKENLWYLDTFILSEESKKALVYPKLIHPVGDWYHVALTLDNKGKMINYINGKMESKGRQIINPLIQEPHQLGQDEIESLGTKGQFIR